MSDSSLSALYHIIPPQPSDMTSERLDHSAEQSQQSGQQGMCKSDVHNDRHYETESLWLCAGSICYPKLVHTSCHSNGTGTPWACRWQ